MRRRPVLWSSLLVFVVVVIGGAFLIRSDRTKKAYDPGPPPAALGLAASPVDRVVAACHDIATVQDVVRRNGSRDAVLRYLTAAEGELSSAVSQQPQWRSLQSGVASLDTGLRNDDASMTSVGIAIARYQCKQAGVTLA